MKNRYKITVGQYSVNGIYKYGIYILDRKRNVLLLLDEKLKPVKNVDSVVACSDYAGCIYLNLK